MLHTDALFALVATWYSLEIKLMIYKSNNYNYDKAISFNYDYSDDFSGYFMF
jgi:hypothetical protein